MFFSVYDFYYFVFSLLVYRNKIYCGYLEKTLILINVLPFSSIFEDPMFESDDAN